MTIISKLPQFFNMKKELVYNFIYYKEPDRFAQPESGREGLWFSPQKSFKIDFDSFDWLYQRLFVSQPKNFSM